MRSSEAPQHSAVKPLVLQCSCSRRSRPHTSGGPPSSAHASSQLSCAARLILTRTLERVSRASRSEVQHAAWGSPPSDVISIAWHPASQKQTASHPAHTSAGNTSLAHTRQRRRWIRAPASVGRASGDGRPAHARSTASTVVVAGEPAGRATQRSQPTPPACERWSCGSLACRAETQEPAKRTALKRERSSRVSISPSVRSSSTKFGSAATAHAAESASSSATKPSQQDSSPPVNTLVSISSARPPSGARAVGAKTSSAGSRDGGRMEPEAPTSATNGMRGCRSLAARRRAMTSSMNARPSAVSAPARMTGHTGVSSTSAPRESR